MAMAEKLKQPATRRDLAVSVKHLRVGLNQVRGELRSGLSDVRAELKASVHRLALSQLDMERRIREDVRQQIAELPSREFLTTLMEQTAAKGEMYWRKAKAHGRMLIGYESRISALERGRGPRQGP